MNWTIEVVVVPVGEVDRAIAFYREQVGFHLDHDTRRLLLANGVAAREISVVDDRDGGTMFEFADPDGNAWVVQQIRARADKPLLPQVH